MGGLDGSKANKFKDITKVGDSYFRNIYTKPNRANIVKILKMTSFFLD